MSIIIFYVSEEGEVSLHNLTKEEAEKRLSPDEDGYCYYGTPNIITEIPDHIMDKGNYLIVIKGTIIEPKAMKVVTRYEL